MDAFVHASGDGFGNTAPLRSDTGAIDMDAISQVAHVTQGAGKLTRKEKKRAKREMKRRKKEAKKAEKEAKKTYSSIKSQLKDRDKELSDKMADARKKRDSAKDVVNYIGYNKMYQDGICEVEEGMFSSSIAFDDTSYHSVRDEQQKAMFSAVTRLYDQFGADTLVQMSVINTPLLKEEVGHRKFFDPERQANDAARNDAQVFNNILNDKVTLLPDKNGSTLKPLQALVGGNIETFDIAFGEGVSLYVNEEGLFTCPPNRAIFATEEMAKAGYLSQLDYSKVVEMGDFYTVLNGDIVAVGFDPETGESRSLTDGETARVEGYFTVISRPGSGAKAVDDIRHGITPGSYDISVESHDCTSGRNALAADAPARDAPGKDNQNIG